MPPSSLSGMPRTRLVALLGLLSLGVPPSCIPSPDPAPDDDDDSASAPDDDDSGGDDDDTAGPWRSALYPPDWTPGFQGPGGAALHDFSYAGYGRSERPLPDTSDWPTCAADDFGADPTGGADSTSGIQAAIDACGSGGRVVLGAGEYRVDDLLLITAPGTVLVGAGPDATRLRFTRLDGMSDRAHLTLRGAPQAGPDQLLVVDAPARTQTLSVDDADGLEPGDHVDVGWVITPEFVDEHGMDGFWAVSNGAWRAFFRREVRAVDRAVSPQVVTVDVPLRYPARLRDGASIRKVTGLLTDVGVEDLSIATAGDPDDAWSIDRSHGILLSGVSDGWVRRVTSWAPPAGSGDHLASGGLKVLDSKRVTVADCSLERPQNRGGGGNGYLFEVSRSSEVLFVDLVARGGRHNYIQNWDFGTSGVVWLRTTSAGGESLTSQGGFATVGASEFHHSLAMANLVDDSVTDDAWKAVNRRTFSSGAGHTATETAFWNLRGAGAVTSLQFGLGYVIGTGPELTVVTGLDRGGLFAEASGTTPEDWTEGLGEGGTLEPQSLFEDQLMRRLGGPGVP